MPHIGQYVSPCDSKFVAQIRLFLRSATMHNDSFGFGPLQFPAAYQEAVLRSLQCFVVSSSDSEYAPRLDTSTLSSSLVCISDILGALKKRAESPSKPNSNPVLLSKKSMLKSICESYILVGIQYMTQDVLPLDCKKSLQTTIVSSSDISSSIVFEIPEIPEVDTRVIKNVFHISLRNTKNAFKKACEFRTQCILDSSTTAEFYLIPNVIAGVIPGLCQLPVHRIRGASALDYIDIDLISQWTAEHRPYNVDSVPLPKSVGKHSIVHYMSHI